MTDTPPDLSLVLACYNEAEHLSDSVARLLALCDLLRLRYEVIFVDDGSTDGTRELLHRIREKYATHDIAIHFNERNVGRGATVTCGLGLARSPIAGFLDIDLEVDAVYVSAFYLAVAAGADMAIARRVYKLSVASLPRYLMTWGYIVLRRRLLHLALEDTEAGFKFFRMAAIRPLLKECEDAGWFWDTEIVTRAHDAGLAIVELTCLFSRRRDKTSTVRPFRDSYRHFRALLTFLRARRPDLRRDLER